MRERGRARIRLDQPGYYFFGRRVMNHAEAPMVASLLAPKNYGAPRANALYVFALGPR